MRREAHSERERAMQIWSQNTGENAAVFTFEVAKVSVTVPVGWWLVVNGETGDPTVSQSHPEQ